jgi:hypothetical protein
LLRTLRIYPALQIEAHSQLVGHTKEIIAAASAPAQDEM